MEPQIDKTIALKLMATCINDLKVFGKTFAPDVFSRPFHELLVEITDLLDSKERFIAVAAPRGVGKTTCVKAAISRAILFRQVHYVIYLSKTQTHAVAQTENIKHFLKTNRFVREYFGDIAVNSHIDEDEFVSDFDDSFSKLSWTAYGDCVIVPRGAGQQIRGSLWRNYRPDLIIVDDLISKEDAESVTRRDKIAKWYYADVMNCFSVYDNKGRAFYIDTVKHKGDLLDQLLNDERWYSKTLQAFDTDVLDTQSGDITQLIKSNAEGYMTTEQLIADYIHAEKQGLLEVFLRERCNISHNPGNTAFNKKDFCYFTEYGNVGQTVVKTNDDKEIEYGEVIDFKALETVVIVDPAKTVNINSADTGFAVITFDPQNNRLLVRYAEGERLYPNELYKKAFELVKIYNANKLVVEVTGIELFIQEPLMAYRSKIYSKVPVMWISQTVPKLQRILALTSYYKQHQVYHHIEKCKQLESQLVDFPISARIDVADVVATSIIVMKNLNIILDSGEAAAIKCTESYNHYLEAAGIDDVMSSDSLYDSYLELSLNN